MNSIVFSNLENDNTAVFYLYNRSSAEWLIIPSQVAPSFGVR